MEGVLWVGDCTGWSVGVLELGPGAEGEFGLRMGGGEDVLVCSLAG